MISHDKKCIFIHIPKCGGTSIEDVIWPKDRGRSDEDLWMGFVSRFENKYQTGGLQHLLAWQVREEVGSDVFGAYYKFAFVRNPLGSNRFAICLHAEKARFNGFSGDDFGYGVQGLPRIDSL